jgi:hypothetical protein
MSDNFGAVSHISSEELAAYLDGRLDGAVQARVEDHLADCAACRSELVEARAVLALPGVGSARSRRARAPRPWAWLAAAGIVAIAALPLMRQTVSSHDSSSPERTAQSTRPTIEVVSPPTQQVDVASLVFAWRPVAGASMYRLTVTDSSGTPLLTVVTSDTAHTAADVALRRGGSYLWYVDGLTSDGRTVTSGIQSFSTAR